MFLGSSPQLELALYTVCLLVRPDTKCHVSIAGTPVYIQTWTQKVSFGHYRSCASKISSTRQFLVDTRTFFF